MNIPPSSSQERAWAAFIEELKKLRDQGGTYDSIAEKLGTTRAVVWEWLNKGKGGKRMSFDVMERHLKNVGLKPSDFFEVDDTAPWANQGIGGVPLIGLAACGVEGWYNKIEMSMKVPRPGDQWQNPDIFAVMAYGSSMVPKGIEQGFVCYCDPRTSLDAGDVAFIERRDRTVAIKEYLGVRDEWTVFRGWLDPDAQGNQKPFLIQELSSTILRIVPVVYVKRKL